MAWVTVLGPDMAQVEYRLDESAGCALSTDAGKPVDAQVSYRLDGELPLEWIGNGLRDVDIQPGTTITEKQKEWARALMSGAHPHTGEVLVQPKLAVDPRAKLPAAPLIAAVGAAMAEQPDRLQRRFALDHRAYKRYEQALRGVFREGDLHTIPIRDAERIGQTAGLDLGQLYPAEQLQLAREHRHEKVVVGNRGYDLTMDIAKSVSVLYAMANENTARQLEDVYLDAVRETVTAMEGWAAYGMRGHHGDGKSADRIATSGLLGWMMVHRTARPVGHHAPDPHLHAHLSFANMVKGTDGKWSTVAAGGRDLHRHAHAADAFLRARMRHITAQRWGIEWARNQLTGAWEIAHIPAAARDLFSKRSSQIAETLERLGIDPGEATTAQSKDAAARSREAKHEPGPGGDLRAEWQRQARDAQLDPAQMTRDAMPGPASATDTQQLTAQDIAAWVFRDGQQLNGDRRPWTYKDNHGLTAHTKVTTRADVLAAVMDAMPGGIATLAEAEAMTDQVLAIPGYAIRLPDKGARHLSNHERYTTADIVNAEQTIVAQARARYGEGAGVVDLDVAAMAISAFEASHGFDLSAEQRLVLQRLLHEGHGVDAVIGVAGSGKTTIMNALRAAYEAEGRTVAGATTAAVAAANLRAESGIRAATVAGWRQRIEHGAGLRDIDVLVIDEAATIDDRELAQLIAHAGQTGTKIIKIGDPKQLRSPGVGGAFAAVHQLVDGQTLADNRRQRDQTERAALALMREGKLREALSAWASTGRVHAVEDAADAHAGMLATWNQARQRWPDPHERIAQLLMLAGTNADVDRLNDTAQVIRREVGELGPARSFALPGGQHLILHVGDQVMFRVNERRDDGPDVLNGYRGIITGFGQDGSVTVQWRQSAPDGHRMLTQTVPPRYVINGGLSLGYALTVAKAQGLTTDTVLVYGNGLDPHTLYPAMSRDRATAHLWLARQLLESDADRARLGPPRTPAEELTRALNAYHAALQQGAEDRMVLEELGDLDLSTPQHPSRLAARRPVPVPRTPEQHQQHQAQQQADQNQMREQLAGMGWRSQPSGRLTDAELTRAIAAADRAQAEAQQRRQAQQRRLAADTAAAQQGHGPASKDLHLRRQQLMAAAVAEQRAEEQSGVARVARTEVAALQTERVRNPVALALSGSSRAKIDQQIRAHLADALVADRVGARARAEAEHYQRLLRLPPGTSVEQAVRELERTWQQQQRQAIEQDVSTMTRRRDNADRLAALAADRDQATATQLRAEVQRRAQLDPAIARAEHTDRDRWREAEVARRQAARQRQAQPSAQRAPQRDSHGIDR